MIIGLSVMFLPMFFSVLEKLYIIAELLHNTPYTLIGIMASIRLLGIIATCIGFFLFSKKLFQEKPQETLLQNIIPFSDLFYSSNIKC